VHVDHESNSIPTDLTTDPICQIWSATTDGGQVVPVRIECAIGRGFSGITMIGGVGQICEDGKERAKAALERLGWVAPARKTIISLSPGDVKIDGTHLDLALCVAMAGVTECEQWMIQAEKWLFAAEVGLNGELRGVSGAVAWASAAITKGLRGIIVAHANLPELECMRSLGGELGGEFSCLGFKTLKQVLDWLSSGIGPDQYMNETPRLSLDQIADELPGDLSASLPCWAKLEASRVNFDDMNLAEELQMIAGVVAAGSHSLLMRGSPGTGKSMFAKRLPSILPSMDPKQHLQSLSIYSALSASVPESVISGRPPFRSPHHYTSLAAIVGTPETPGELSLASGGILFLDELPEFRRDVLEGLREPLETGEVAVSRAHGRVLWSADVILVAASNNCPCGWASSRRRRCECPPSRLNAYRNRLSGPLQDRIDLHVNMPEPTNQIKSLLEAPVARQGQTKRLRDQVTLARHLAVSRFEMTGVRLNKDIPASRIFAALKTPRDKAESLVTKIIPGHSGTRSILRCLRVARTIADLSGQDQVDGDHLALAWSWQAMPAAVKRGELTPLPLKS
jgi:magnesium chelatase family protein